MTPKYRQLVEACKNGNLKEVLELIPQTEPKLFQSLPIRMASKKGYADIVLALLPHSDPYAGEGDVLKNAIEDRNSTLFDILVNEEALFKSYIFCNCFCSLVLEGWHEKINEIEQKYSIAPKQWREALDVFLEFGDDSQLETLKFCLSKVPDYSYEETMGRLVSKQKTKSATYLFELHQKFSRSFMNYVLDKSIGSGLLEELIDLAVLEGIPHPIQGHKQKDCLEWVVSDANLLLLEKVLPFIKKKHHEMPAVVVHHDIELFDYFTELGFTANEESVLISATNHYELTKRQISQDTVSTDLLLVLAAQGWSNLLDEALSCGSCVQLSTSGHNFKRLYGSIDEWAQKCVDEKKYSELLKIWKNTCDDDTWVRMPSWMDTLCKTNQEDDKLLNIVVSGLTKKRLKLLEEINPPWYQAYLAQKSKKQIKGALSDTKASLQQQKKM